MSTFEQIVIKHAATRLAYYRHLRAQGFAALDAFRYIKHWSK